MGASAYTEERLREAARGARTLSEALERLGVDPRSPTRCYIARRMRRLGVDTSHFEREGTRWTRAVLEPVVAASASVNEVVRTERTRDNRRCRTAEEILVENTSEHATRVPGRRLKRAMNEMGVEERCAGCGTDPVWRGRPLPLEVDHIDGDWSDDRRKNLRLLCPNCHATTSTWCRGGRRGHTHPR
ncbi:HNH endonuclease [Streptomyces malaysiense]|uniref:HNH endonuclease n=1 Tax=Streptomyces malaysiense TaxID=1428626 RepID=A0A1J4PSW8_9ACTN|nr:HNH endonuclease [Streptomyces malaysiense]OIK23214.1 HNH endonuclease [Streptomyces malaysiense]